MTIFWIVIGFWALVWYVVAWCTKDFSNLGPADLLASSIMDGALILVLTGLCSAGTLWLISR